MTDFNPYDIETNLHNNEQCPICKEQMTEENYYAIPECGHIFHTNCIITWFRSLHPNCPLCNDVGMNIPMNNKGGNYWTYYRNNCVKGEELYKMRRMKLFPKSVKIQKMIESITNTKQQLLQNTKDCRKYRQISFEEATQEGFVTPKEIQSKIYELRRKSWSLKRRLRNQYSKLGVVPIRYLIIPRIVNVNE
jgi:hypothetical protein